MKYYIKGLIVALVVLFPVLFYIYTFEDQKNYVDISYYGVVMFGVLSILLFVFLTKSLKSTNKQLFISITLTNMLVKMVCSIMLLLIYKEINQPPDGKFIIPFLSIYLTFTIFETWFMVRLADENLKNNMTTSTLVTTFDIEHFASFDDPMLENAEVRIIAQEGDKFKLLFNNKVFVAALRSFDAETKIARINIDGYHYQIKINESIDHLVKDLGFLSVSKHSIKEIRSPMPGLVVTVFVEIGQQVNDGDKLLSLEAMKMENILKSPGDGIVKSITVMKGSTVDKNQVLINFE